MKKWNQSQYPKYFLRRICPICGENIPEDNGYGAMEMWEYCSERTHYSRFISIFADSVRIMGKSFEPDQVEEIEAWLDEVGNKAFMVEVENEKGMDKMITLQQGQIEACQKTIKNSYQGLKFLEESRERGRDIKTLTQSVFGIAEHMILTLAETFQLDSKVAEELKTKITKTKERNSQIEKLEEKLVKEQSFKDFSKNVSFIKTYVDELWNKEGFQRSTDFKITRYGEITVSLGLMPVLRVTDMERSLKKQTTIEKLKASFDEKALETVQSQDYIFVKDADSNKQKIKRYIEKNFPGAELLSWQTRRGTVGEMILSRADILITSLDFLEGGNEHG